MADVGPGWGYFSAHLNPEKEDTVVYAWGGRGEEDDYKANGKFDLFLEAWEGTDWNAQGEPPNLFNGACAAIGPIIYFYGGRGEGKDAFSSALYQLDTTTMMWTKVADAVNPGPMRKKGCRMVAFKNQLVLFGGYGIPNDPPPGDGTFKEGPTEGQGWTKELHMFDPAKGEWNEFECDSTHGPPPCSDFSFTMVNDDCAVLCEGERHDDDSTSKNSVYKLDMQKKLWYEYEPINTPCRKRSLHAAVCLNYGSDSPRILISGGRSTVKISKDVMEEATILEIFGDSNAVSAKWHPVTNWIVPERFGHTAHALAFSSTAVDVVMLGGYTTEKQDDKLEMKPADSQVVVLQFVKESDGEWRLRETHTQGLGTPERIREKMKRLKDKDAEIRQLRQEMLQKDAAVKKNDDLLLQANDKIRSLQNEMKKQEMKKQASPQLPPPAATDNRKVVKKQKHATTSTKEPSLYLPFLKCCN